MSRIRYGLALVGLVVTVSYANTNSSDSPLGVVPKDEQKENAHIPAPSQAPIPAPNQTSTPTVPEIPRNIQNAQGRFPEEAALPKEPEGTLAATPEGKDRQISGKKKTQKAPETTMPLRDKRVVGSAITSATQRPGDSASTESKIVYSYTPDSMYTIYGAPGRVIDVQLQPGEKLTSPVIAGDTVRWVVGSATSLSGIDTMTHVLIKPIQAGLETNFIITTDHHAYHLIAKSFNRTFLPAVAWTYPHEEMAKYDTFTPESSGETVNDSVLFPDRLNFKYIIKSDHDYSWTPVRAFDDGRKTYIQMSSNMKNTEAPAFFVKEKGGLNLVNYRVKGDYYVIDRMFEEGEFRCGKDEIVVVRKDKPWSFFGS